MHPYRPVDPFGRTHAMIYHSRPQNRCGPFKANARKSKGSRTGTSLGNHSVRKFCRTSCALLPTITWITVEKKQNSPKKKLEWSFQNGTWTHDKSTSSKFEHHQPIQLKQLLLASARLAPASTPVSIPRTTLCTPTSPLPFAPPASRSKQQAVSFRPVQKLTWVSPQTEWVDFFQGTIVTH